MEFGNIRLGIDIGSTTLKVVIIADDIRNKSAQGLEILFSEYKRHNADVYKSLLHTLEYALAKVGNIPVSIVITGSAGLGIAEKYDIPFVQELIASTNIASRFYPEAKTLIDIGGEDTKIIFFNQDRNPDIRMNDNCAGGTGSFIDQMATLMNVSINELDSLAENHRNIYPIASRCGVFAKTDVQNLLCREISPEDIAASIFHAVAVQSVTTLSRGFEINPSILFCGGPLTFLPMLRKIFLDVLKLSEQDIILPERPELLPAIGVALSGNGELNEDLQELVNRIKSRKTAKVKLNNRLNPLFEDEDEFTAWNEKRFSTGVNKIKFEDLADGEYFLGIDSGSTTSKVVLIDKSKSIAFDFYASNKGKPIEAVAAGLCELKQYIEKSGKNISIVKTAVTGYGEDLIRAAFALDEGVVETIAHFRAARTFNEDVSFILDIGGQDMKAIFVEDGVIKNIEINEACSSGCGSFIEMFSSNLGYEVSDFASAACNSDAPCNLGTRCTVFMNSKVKQSIREGASVGDISAGLAFSVVRNLFFKVLKINDISILGNNIVVQGGTFKNPAIHRALEIFLKKNIQCPEIAELMGAYGAALTALYSYAKTRESGLGIRDSELGRTIPNPEPRTTNWQLTTDNSSTFDIRKNDSICDYEKKILTCQGCLNHCPVTVLTFNNNNRFFTGNRCEKIFSNSGKKFDKGFNLLKFKYDLLFNRETAPKTEQLFTVGIPKVLFFFENFPFWNTLFVECGINVQLSSDSSVELCELGANTVMSENICYPAKLAHGHIFDLINKGVDRIFYPLIPFEKNYYPGASDSFNCPIVSGYVEVIKSAIKPEEKFGIPIDSPTITFNDEDLLKKACYQYLKQFKISKKVFNTAFNFALNEMNEYKDKVRKKAENIIAESKENEKFLVVLAGRPYHIDPQINHRIPEYITDFGVDVITEDSIPTLGDDIFNDVQVLTQWAFTNRLYEAAKWVRETENAEFVQLNSFGCGPDALAIDESKSILNEYDKNHTLIRIDENSSPGSVKLRIRSLIESLRIRKKQQD